MKQTSRGLAPSLNTGHSTFTGARQRLAVALVAIVIAFAGAQTAWAQTPCNIRFDISSGGTVKLQREGQWLEVTNGKTIPCLIPSVSALTLTPETGYVVSSITCDATDGLSIDLFPYDDHWDLNIHPYGGSETPTITVHIVFNKVGGADEASAVALTADDDFHLAGGWYKVESDLTLGHTVILHGDTHITIATGATLTVNTSGEYGISGSALTVSGEGTLAVSANRAIYVDNYTQMGCAVTLSGSSFGLHATNDVSISGGSLTTSGAFYGIDTDNGSITISGGTVSSSGDSDGLFAGAAVSITGGTVSASGNYFGIRGYSVSITGGQVTASSGGIVSIVGDITLGWTSATDYITASGYVLQKDGQHVKIADGQKLYGGGFPSASFTGTIGDPSALNGLMLRPTAAVTVSGTNEYTIKTADGWDAFCDRLAADDGKAFFSGKTVKLAADITVSRMAGASQHDFCGTFDGQGYTLTFTSTENVNGVAPFSYVSETTPTGGTEVSHPAIRNLNVVADINTTAQYASALVGRMWCTLTIEGCTVGGTIQTSNKYAAGFIAEQNGNASITDCRSSVTIQSSVEGDGTHGGFVAECKGVLNITGCLFDGKLLTTNGTTHCAGFVGYGACNITNSLYAPAAIGQDETEAGTDESATFARGTASGITIANCYYTRDFNDGTNNTGRGKQLRTIAAGEGVTLGHAGEATEYSVSGITAYKASGASGDSDPFIAGIIYNNVLYAGSGDQVSLTLAHQDREGYEFQSYTASAGTLSGDANPYTLTTPNADVTVTATWAKVYNLGNCWHVPAAAEPTGTYMRNPIHPYASLDVTIYNGNQAYEYEGENPGNPGDQSGGTIYYRAEGASAWQTVPMYDDTEIENNKYWRGTIPANTFAEGNTVEYVIKVTYNEHDDTYLGLAAKGETASTAFGTMAEAEAHPFSFKYLTPNTVDYIDENGQTQTVTATLLTDDLLNSDLGIDGATTWYVVNEDITHSGQITCRGNVNIILADGKKLTTSNLGGNAIYGDNGTLTIYGQTNGTGTLNATATADNCIKHNGNVAICGGTVNATSNGRDAIFVIGSVTINGGQVTANGNIGISGSGGVTINGGTVTATATMLGIASNGTVTITGGTVNATGQTGIQGNGGVTINGGQVTATATNGGQGIISYGDIILGWTTATDYITASGFTVEEGKHVKIADGQKLYGDGFPSASYNGTIGDPSALNGLMLRPTAAVTESGTNEYTIKTADGWDAFCDRLAADDGKAFFSGKTVKLGADITVSRMAGSSQHDFCGTFDGQEHTLTVSYSGSSYVAPFSYVDGATIQNLVVEGTISSGTRAAGVIGETGSPETTGKSYITNCVSSSTITGGNYSGGFSIGGNVEIEGCVFNGIINSDGNSGGFVGYSQSALTITNSLFAPQSGSSAKGTFYYNGTAGTLTNCYYTQTLGDGQGKQLRTIAAGEGVTLGHDGAATEYSVSGITAYKASDASGDSDPFIAGIIYNNVLYAGSGEDVSLTLTNSSGEAPLGYKNGDYSATGGATLSGSTLTMADEDVTVSFTPGALRSTGEAVLVSYIDAYGILCDGQDGRPDPASAIALDGTESDLGQYGEETWYFVGADISYSGRIDCYGNVNIILADGYTMTVNNDDGIFGAGGSNDILTIYGQTFGTGTLDITATNNGIYYGIVVIRGGTVNAAGTYQDGIQANGNVTITGGKVTVTGNSLGIFAGGDITLGCTNATDFIKASRYCPGGGKSVNIADGQTLYDEDGNPYSGNRVDFDELAGKTLRPYDCRLALAARQAPDGNYWTTYYNGTTGFTIDADENACAYTATYSAGQLTLHKLGKEIPKNTAVIIVADNDVVSMTATDLDDFSGTNDLRGVDTDTPVADIIVAAAAVNADLAGATPFVLGMTVVDGQQHFGFHRYTGEEMAAHKAFVLVPAAPGSNARSLDMVFEETTGIEGIEVSEVNGVKEVNDDSWYTINGRKLNGKPVKAGLYVNNGRKVVIN